MGRADASKTNEMTTARKLKQMGAILRKMFILVFVAAALVSVAAGCLLASAEPIGGIVTDVIVGRNNKGPYRLSWTEIDPKSVVAVINGRTLGKDEYAIDASKGTVSFSSVLLRDALVRFTYSLTPKSKRSEGNTSIPVTLKLLSRDDASVQVTGLHVAPDPKNPNAGKTIVGLSGERAWSAGKVSSQLLMSQENDAAGGDQGGGMDRSVLKVGAEAGKGTVKFTGSFLNAGDKFSGEKEYGIAAGRQESDLAVRFNPGKRMEATASMKTVEDTAGKNKGGGSVVHEQTLSITPSDTTKVSLSHATKETHTALANSERKTETSRLNIDQRLGDTTKASILMENTTVDASGRSEDTTIQKLSVVSKPVEQVNVSAHLQQKNSDSQGEELSTSATLQVKPSDQMAIEATHATVQSSLSGVATDTSVSLKAAAPGNTEIKAALVEKSGRDFEKYQRDVSLVSTPVRYARLTGIFSQKGLNDQDDVITGAALELTPFSHTRLGGGYKYIENGSSAMRISDFSASSRPWDFLEFSGSYRDREAAQQDAVDSTLIRLAISPRKSFSLTAAYQSNPENDKGEIQPHDASTVGARMKFGTVGLSAEVSRKEDRRLMQESEERSVGLEVPAFGAGRITTGYKTARLFGSAESGSDTYTLGFRKDVGSSFNLLLSGRYTQYRGPSTEPNRVEYGADASLGMRF